MASAEKLLQKAAEDGSLDAADWPEALEYILDRLDEIVTTFPKPPRASSPAPNTPSTSRRHTQQPSSQDSHTGDKENALPRTPARPPVPGFASESSQDLPQDIVTFYASIRHALSSNFPKGAPHTIQRLAELLLAPKQRYKFLPAYLRALDRVISVSSPNTIFPLPQAVLPSATGLLNGATSSSAQASLGSDEALGGALLTPIPWLQGRAQNELVSESTEMVDGPNGAGRIETVTVGMLSAGAGGNGGVSSPQGTSPTAAGAPVSQISSSHPDGESLPSTGPVTQGEILRQEQEAGVVLNNPHSLTENPSGPGRIVVAGGEMESASGAGRGGASSAVVDSVEGEEEQPHARGPEIIGMEDTGPQGKGGLDIEGAVGRPSIERESRSPQPKDEVMGDVGEADDGGEQKGKGKADGDGDGDEEMKTE